MTWWHAIGGLASAFYVCSTIMLFARLGSIVSVGLFIAGQMMASLALDGFGLIGVERAPIGVAGVLGALAVVVGAALIVGAQETGEKGAGQAASKPGWVLLALVAGVVLPVQGAVNSSWGISIDQEWPEIRSRRRRFLPLGSNFWGMPIRPSSPYHQR